MTSIRRAKRELLKWRRYSDRLPRGALIPMGETRAWWRLTVLTRYRVGGLMGVPLSVPKGDD